MEKIAKEITFDDFLKVDMRVGKIIQVENFPEAKKPAYKLTIDFGKEIGLSKSSAQITKDYTKDELVGKKIIAVVNFPPKQIVGFMSEVLVLGLPKGDGCILLTADKDIELGLRVY